MSVTIPSRSRHEKFPHKDVLKLNGVSIQWKEVAGGEIVFKMINSTKDDPYHKLSDFIRILRDRNAEKFKDMDRDGVELAIVNMLLAHYRPHALPDENGYYAASLGVTNHGKLFVAVNNEIVIKHAFAGRGCAETTMLRKCQESEGADVKLEAIYLMSGMAKKLPNGKLVDKNLGHVSCLCGECRQNVRSHTLDARFIMVPTNDGTARLTLNRDAKNYDDLGPNQAWEFGHETLYPMPETREVNDGEMACKGYDYITDATKPVVRLDLGLPDDVSELTPAQYALIKENMEVPSMAIRAVNYKPTLTNINRALLAYIKDAYAHHPDKAPIRNIEIIATIIKTNDNEYYPGVLVNGALWLPTKPPEMPTALSNTYNQKGIAEVYVMTFDDHALQNAKLKMEETGEALFQLPMPDPAGLGRLLKNLLPGDQPSIRVMCVNDGLQSEGKLLENSAFLDPRASFGPDFAYPKRAFIRSGADTGLPG